MSIDLAKLPAPSVIDALNYESILGDMVAQLEAATDGSGKLLFTTPILESDPAQKILEVVAMRELALRQRVNDAAHDVMLAFAGGSNLDQLAALFETTRQPGQDDAGLLAAIVAAPSSWSAAGPAERYRQTALGVAGVRDAWATRNNPGLVRVYVLANDAADGTHDGTPSAAVRSAVGLALDDQYVRPLCDTVEVAAATVTHYRTDITLSLASGPDPTTVLAAARAALTAYVGYIAPATPATAKVFGALDAPLGREVTMAGLIAAAMSPASLNAVVRTTRVAGGVVVTDLMPAMYEALYCDSVTVHI